MPNMVDAKKRTNSSFETIVYKYDKKYDNLGKNKKYYLRTYGCQMNERDSENIRGILESVGFEEVTTIEDSDLILLNTCAIRENVHDKVFGILGRVKHLKEEKKNVICGMCGCMAQERNVTEKIAYNLNFVDLVFGTHNINKLLEYLYNIYIKNERQIEVFSCEGNILENMPSVRDSKIKAYVNIQLGCDKFCTYCIVPYTRGKQRSRSKDSILKEIIELKNNGYKEITLLGQNVNSYGKEIYDNYDFSDLLIDVSKTNIERIRFVTSHPWDFNDKMIEVISEYENIMPYIHLPLQSGSNRILKLMGRKYTKEEYINLFLKIKEKVKNATITTDIIVGFPGETDEEFLETLDVVSKCKFDGAYTFIFSPRENTPASRMKELLSEDEKRKRLHVLNELVNNYSNLSNKNCLNKTVKVLIEGISEKNSDNLFGYTEEMKLVNIVGDKKYIGLIKDVKIIETKSFSLNGVIL